jgi:hypothetical protein
MNSWKVFVLAPIIAVAAACGRDDRRAAADSALNRDLNLANQVAPYSLVDSMEAGLYPTVVPVGAAAPAEPRPAARSTSSTARGATVRRSSSGMSSRASSGRTVTTSSGGEVVVKKNTKRDAIIGAAAGAAIGAATSKDRVKGAVIGGVVGGVIGGVIGNNVDVKKTKKP